ncbi:MAG: ribonuclease N1 [Actinobacteria bacterium]|nr:ribonuclease N1 [Actinomycetota bacterium]
MVGALVVLAAWFFVSFTGESPQDPSATPTTSASASLVARDSVQTDIDSSGATSGLPTVALRDLPSEAQQAHRLILDGGPYPYPQDDGVFGNREQNLPGQEYGWYREYTIVTPGSPDRGAQRFVVGQDGVFFYTDDHYDSFREVIQ